MHAPRFSLFVTAILLSAAATSHAGDIPQPYGTAAQAASAQREIKVGPMTKYVNVERGEIVRFVTEQGTFAWSFDTDRNRNVFDFIRIAPYTLSANSVRVFVGEPSGDR